MPCLYHYYDELSDISLILKIFIDYRGQEFSWEAFYEMILSYEILLASVFQVIDINVKKAFSAALMISFIDIWVSAHCYTRGVYTFPKAQNVADDDT